MIRRILITAAMTLTASVASADIIAERKAGFKGNIAALKTIKSALGAGDLTPVIGAAESVADWSARMTSYFPEGSDEGETNARMDIWLDFDDFTAKAKSAEDAALKLAALAKAGDMDGAKQGFKSLAGTCKTCHQSYKD